eukprot:scaffold63969_cov18-Phaeocystis_antarctica.AAC.1
MPTAYGYGPSAPRSTQRSSFMPPTAIIGPMRRAHGSKVSLMYLRAADVDQWLRGEGSHVELELGRVHLVRGRGWGQGSASASSSGQG